MWELQMVVDTKAKCNSSLEGKGAKNGLVLLLGEFLTNTPVNLSITIHFR